MDGVDKEIASVPISAETILRRTSENYRRLSAEAREASDKGDLEECKNRYREAGELVAELDEKLKQTDSSKLSQGDHTNIEMYSRLAREYMKKGNFFGIGVMFDRLGAKIGEPNDLEKLIERTYPIQKPQETKA